MHNLFKQLTIKERAHFLRAIAQPLADIIDALVALFTFGLYRTSLSMKVMVFIAKKELKSRK